ncbi:hypothetical protein FHX08_003038 [Rhizobium sp. BK529]|uniref:hypothetical protein n=1 Tax=unclassified Rhizobium TaxID=2613769 RepID=UPI00104E391A|nr:MULTISPECIES: hypothetical protein [unclassified Rhizobium]MBB3592694.1 hypothetical protein [Rhizobium sp. BK529]TCS07090.1 hypothetical protein EV281_102703 [Rhizobium sp. BK418]
MTNVMKNGLVAVAFGAIISVSAFAPANAAPAQHQQVVKQQKSTNARQEPRATGSVNGASSSSVPYQYSPKKPLNMDCSLRFNPTSSSGCNY